MQQRRNSLMMIMVFGLVLGLCAAFVAQAEAGTGKWKANTEADLAGYYADMAPGPCAAPGPWSRVAVFPREATTGIFPTPTDGVYCGRLAAFDTAGNVSGFSAPAEVEININPPSAPEEFSLTAP